MKHISSGVARSFVLLTLSAAALSAQNQIFDSRTLAPYVPTPQSVVDRMLVLAETTEKDVVFDLGSGDGRILFTAAGDFNAKAVGIEINENLAQMTRERVKNLGLEDRITVIQQHLLEVDLSPATVVTVYLLTSSNDKLRPKLEKELRPGARVVSHDFQFRGWTPDATVEFEGESRVHRLYLYRMTDAADGSTSPE